MKSCGIGLVTALLCAFTTVAYTAPNKALSQQTYRVLMTAQGSLEKGQTSKAIASLKKLSATLGKSPYEQAIVLQNLSNAHIAREEYRAAIPPLKRSLSLNALPAQPQQRARYNLINLHMATDGFLEAIKLLKVWFSHTKTPRADAYVMLATAYLQLGRFQEAVVPLRKAIRMSTEPRENWYQSLLWAQSELKQFGHCATLLQTMLKLFPGRPDYWRQLAGIQLTRERYRDALATMELAYLRGHIKVEKELLDLAQLYLHLNAPYKAAALMENEIRRGRIKKAEKNWEHLGNAWLLAREANKAIAALESARGGLHDPRLDLRLAQLYMESRRWNEAGDTLDSIISGAKLDAAGTGRAWMLLGIVRYEAKLPGAARVAFEQARKYPKTADDAAQWLALIDQT